MNLRPVPFTFKTLRCDDCGHVGYWRTRAAGYGYVLGDVTCDWCEEQRQLKMQAEAAPVRTAPVRKAARKHVKSRSWSIRLH